jgi:hypothetical protein
MKERVLTLPPESPPVTLAGDETSAAPPLIAVALDAILEVVCLSGLRRSCLNEVTCSRDLVCDV